MKKPSQAACYSAQPLMTTELTNALRKLHAAADSATNAWEPRTKGVSSANREGLISRANNTLLETVRLLGEAESIMRTRKRGSGVAGCDLQISVGSEETTSKPIKKPYSRDEMPKEKKPVDTRASKGRKTRYVTIEKLVNFFPAAPEEVPWPHEKRDKLFKSLFL